MSENDFYEALAALRVRTDNLKARIASITSEGVARQSAKAELSDAGRDLTALNEMVGRLPTKSWFLVTVAGQIIVLTLVVGLLLRFGLLSG